MLPPSLFGRSMRVSLITGTKGFAEGLPRLLASLNAQAHRDFELIIVDQNDNDRLDRMLRAQSVNFPLVHLRTSPGLSKARNVGLEHARAELIAFPDDDCWYGPRVLADVVRLLTAHGHLDFVTGKTTDADGRPSVSVFLDYEAPISKRNSLMVGNSNSLFFHRRVFKMVGGFDERLGVGTKTPFQSGDESDFLLRAIEHGLQGRFFPEIVVHHPQVTGKLFAGEVSRAYAYGLGFGALLRKHEFPFWYLLYKDLRPLARAAFELMRWRPALAQYKLRWARGVIQGYFLWTEMAFSFDDSTAKQRCDKASLSVSPTDAGE